LHQVAVIFIEFHSLSMANGQSRTVDSCILTVWAFTSRFNNAGYFRSIFDFRAFARFDVVLYLRSRWLRINRAITSSYTDIRLL